MIAYKGTAAVKGSVAETQLMQIIQHLLPSDEILDVSEKDATGDIIVHRYDSSKPSILFESKDYSKTVDTIEVYKYWKIIINGGRKVEI